MRRPNGRKVFLSILMVLTLVFSPLVVQPVGAVEPQIETFHNEGTVIVAECDGFLAVADFVQDVRLTTFFDNEGNPVGAQGHVKQRSIVTNSVTGKSVSDDFDVTGFFDFEEGTLAVAGSDFRITVPGEGIVVLGAGKFVLDADGNLIFSAGPDEWLTDPTLVCQALD